MLVLSIISVRIRNFECKSIRKYKSLNGWDCVYGVSMYKCEYMSMYVYVYVFVMSYELCKCAIVRKK